MHRHHSDIIFTINEQISEDALAIRKICPQVTTSSKLYQRCNFIAKFSLTQWNDLSHIDMMKLVFMTVYPVKLYLLITQHYTSTENTEKMVKKTPNELVNEMIHYNSYGADQLLTIRTHYENLSKEISNLQYQKS